MCLFLTCNLWQEHHLQAFAYTLTRLGWPSGAFIPHWDNDAFPPFHISEKTPWKIFPIWPFPNIFPIFICTNFWWPFLVIDHNLEFRPIFPLFSLFQYISPLFRENYYPPDFVKFTCFLHTVCVSPTLNMVHLCITQCTYWMPLMTINCLWSFAKLQHLSTELHLNTGKL